jgi:dTDP-4-amino-4,6-dideoxygalactose transaminase
MGCAPGQFPNAEAFYESSLSIPLFPAMSDADVERVIDDVSEAASGL